MCAEVAVALADDVRTPPELLPLVRRRREVRVDLAAQQRLHPVRVIHRDQRRVERPRVPELHLCHLP
jgi:hypothetical protein